MQTVKRPLNSSYSLVGLGVCFAAALLVGAACKCGDIGSTDVPPDCPNGTRAAASLTIQYDLSRVNDVGVDKQVRINGNRTPGQDNCFQPGSNPSISALTIAGQGSGNQGVSNLQDGTWQITVQVIGGSSDPQPPQNLTGVLAPGVAHTLTLTNNPDGTLKATL